MTEIHKPDWKTIRSRAELEHCLERNDLVATAPTEPFQTSWGYFLKFSRLGYFSWFATRADLLFHLVQIEILLSPTAVPDRQHYESQVQQMISLAAQWEAGQASGPETCAALSALLPDGELLWLGQFNELCQSDEDFAQTTRKAYRSERIAAIPASEQAAFAAFLEQYGLD